MPDIIMGQAALDTTARYCDNVWKNCPYEDIERRRLGICIGDDFDSFYATGNKYSIVGASASVVPVATAPGGLLNVTCNAAANGEAYLAGGIALGAFCMVEANKPNAVYWETRVKVSDIVNGVFITGLTKASDVAAGMLVNGTLVPATTVSAFGFRTLVGTPSRLDIFYMDDAAATVYKTGAKTLTTAAFVKLGIRFDGTRGGFNNVVHFFVDGVEIPDTNGNLGVACTATNFPDNIGLHTFWGCKSNATAALTMSIDWWRGAQTILDTTYDAA